MEWLHGTLKINSIFSLNASSSFVVWLAWRSVSFRIVTVRFSYISVLKWILLLDVKVIDSTCNGFHSPLSMSEVIWRAVSILSVSFACIRFILDERVSRSVTTMNWYSEWIVREKVYREEKMNIIVFSFLVNSHHQYLCSWKVLDFNLEMNDFTHSILTTID